MGLAIVGALAAAISIWVGLASAKPKSSKDKEVPVRVSEAVVTDLPLRAVRRGELDADAAELAAKSGGYLVALTVGIGDQVKAGDILAQVEPDQAHHAISEAHADAMAAQAEKKRIAAELAAAEAENERAQKAFAKQLISEKDALDAKYKMEALRAQSEAAQARQSQVGARVQISQDRLSDTSLTAPFDGAVAARYVDPGSIVQPGTAVLRLVKNGPLRVRFRIPERELNLVRVDMPFEVTTQATGDKHFRGKLTRIAAEVSRVDRTVAVEGILADETPLLRPGMYSEVSLDLGQLDDAVVVPSGSIIEQVGTDGQKQVGVFVVVDDKAKWTPISVKGVSGDRSAVDTLSAGARVVVLGHDSLRDGAPVRISEAPTP